MGIVYNIDPPTWIVLKELRSSLDWYNEHEYESPGRYKLAKKAQKNLFDKFLAECKENT